MNIYKFFNSRDIAEHCKNIDHKFTALEAAYIVWRSNHNTLADKHKAFHKIISSMSDDKFPDKCAASLHDFLRKYIKLQREYIRDFFTVTGNHLYTFEVLKRSQSTYSGAGIFYSSYKECINDAKFAIANTKDEDIIRAKIIKFPFYSNHINYYEHETLVFNEKFSLLNTAPCYRDYDQNDDKYFLQMPTAFREMKLSIPSPFHKGDIVIDVYDKLCGKRDWLVMEELTFPYPDFEGSGCGFDMHRMLNLHHLGEDGDIDYKIGVDFLDLEYCRDEPTKADKILYAISDHLQGKLHLSTLLREHSRFLKGYDNLEEDDDEYPF